MRRRFLIGGTVAAFAAAVLLLGGVFRSQPRAAVSDALPAAVADELQRGFAAGDTQALVGGLQEELRDMPRNVKALETLGLAYQQRARETGDPTYYGKADGVLHRALALRPDDLIATAGLGQLALSRHRFREALVLGERARRISPTTAGVYGVIGDAQVELGRYREAFAAFDRMASLKPSVSSYARVSYARELRGDVVGAERAMRLAVDSAIGEREASAWTRAQLALLYVGSGHARRALTEVHAALAAFPGYPFALDAAAQVEVGLGHANSAIAYEQEAVARVPLPQYVELLGDLYASTGHVREAQREYGLIAVIQRLLAVNGVRNDLDVALFDVDHAIDLRRSLVLARRGHAERPSVVGDDVLAWALARNGRCDEALHYSQRSLRLGTRDALKFFHRGWIESCLGNRAAAASWYRRALRLNPHFSVLWAPAARKGAFS
jgi:tetratricopeptide (TPR) repeat protein